MIPYAISVVDVPALTWPWYMCCMGRPQKRVDDAIQRRRVEVREAVQRVERVKRRLRITVTNTHANQPSTASEGPTSAGESTGPSEPPCWTLLIHGRILDPDPSTAAAAGTAQTAAGAAAAGAVGPLGSAGAVGAHAAGANLSGAAVAGAGATPAAAAAAAALGATGGAAGAGAPGSAAPAAGAQPAAGAAGAAPGAGPAPGQAAAQAAANQALAPKYPLTAYLRRVEVGVHFRSCRMGSRCSCLVVGIHSIQVPLQRHRVCGLQLVICCAHPVAASNHARFRLCQQAVSGKVHLRQHGNV